MFLRLTFMLVFLWSTAGFAGSRAPGTIPIGGVIAVFSHIPGGFPVLSGNDVKNGFMMASGGLVTDPKSPLYGSTLPNLNGGTYLRGAEGSSSVIGGSNASYVLSSTTMPSHRHTMTHTHSGTTSGISAEHYHSINLPTATSGGATTTISGSFHFRDDNNSNYYLGATGGSSITTVSGKNPMYHPPSTTVTGYESAVIDYSTHYHRVPLRYSTGVESPTSHTHSATTNTVTYNTGSAGTTSSITKEPKRIQAVFIIRIK